MQFAARSLTDFSEPISSSDLKADGVYFSVTYVDDDLKIPTIETIVYVGKDLSRGDVGRFYFQQVDSHRRGERIDCAKEIEGTAFFVCTSKELSAVFEFDKALEELLRCEVRRRG